MWNIKAEIAAWQSIFTKPRIQGKAKTIASYGVSHVLVKYKKLFENGDVVKEAFFKAADSLVEAFNNKTGFNNKTQIMTGHKEVQLSHNTFYRQYVGIAMYVEEQLRDVIDVCERFSLQFDELTDMVDVAHLCVFIRLLFEDMTAKEELLTILALTGHNRGEDSKW